MHQGFSKYFKFTEEIDLHLFIRALRRSTDFGDEATEQTFLRARLNGALGFLICCEIFCPEPKNEVKVLPQKWPFLMIFGSLIFPCFLPSN